MEELLTVTSAMVAAGKAEVDLLNKYITQYSDLVFGPAKGTSKSGSKDDLLKNMKGFQEVFKEKITFKAKVGDKIEKEMQSVSLEDLIKSRTN